MTARRPCSPAPGPLEAYTVQFDSLFHSLAQQHNFRDYLAGLLLPRDRPKTLTAPAGAAPLMQAQAARTAAAILPLRVTLGCRSDHRTQFAIARRRSPDCADRRRRARHR